MYLYRAPKWSNSLVIILGDYPWSVSVYILASTVTTQFMLHCTYAD